jgi:hypothetical protein
MSAQPDIHELKALVDKVAELDAAIGQFVQTANRIGTHFDSYNRVRLTSGAPVKEGASALYEALKQCPGSFSTLAAQAEQLAKLTAELNAAIFENYLK